MYILIAIGVIIMGVVIFNAIKAYRHSADVIPFDNTERAVARKALADLEKTAESNLEKYRAKKAAYLKLKEELLNGKNT